jgi:branched-chain amino acid transport system permease protein
VNIRALLRRPFRSQSSTIFSILLLFALFYPPLVDFASGGQGSYWVGLVADAGVWVLLAIGLNVVVGYAGLLDLGYAAFFAIGAYTAGMFASGQLSASPLHHDIHIPFWLLLFVAMFVAACFGVILGAPTLRLRGDYLAIVTLGFGEIVPRIARNMGFGSPLGNWTGGVNGISALDQPMLPAWITGPWANPGQPVAIISPFSFAFDNTAYYVLIVILVFACVILITNLYRSRLGRAWMAIREDEVAAAAMGVNTVATKLLAFSIGASFSGFAGCYYGIKLSLISPEAFSFTVSVTVLMMVVVGGMGNLPGVIVGSLLVYFVNYYVLFAIPDWGVSLANLLGLNFLVQGNPARNWPGLHDELALMQFLIFGIILVAMMLLRPQGLIPSRVRAQELKHAAVEETVFDARAEVKEA